jgi:hypothetical protein
MWSCKNVKLSLSHSGKSRMKVYESRILRRVSGTRNGKVIREWKQLNNEELYNRHS